MVRILKGLLSPLSLVGKSGADWTLHTVQTSKLEGKSLFQREKKEKIEAAWALKHTEVLLRIKYLIDSNE